MNTQKNNSLMMVGICALLAAGAGTLVLSAQQEKVVSSYGPINQDATFDQIKAARMAVKAGRSEDRRHGSHVRRETRPGWTDGQT